MDSAAVSLSTKKQPTVSLSIAKEEHKAARTTHTFAM
jgi:hypothetical protein